MLTVSVLSSEPALSAIARLISSSINNNGCLDLRFPVGLVPSGPLAGIFFRFENFQPPSLEPGRRFFLFFEIFRMAADRPGAYLPGR
jgi:hypothetical protein